MAKVKYTDHKKCSFFDRMLEDHPEVNSTGRFNYVLKAAKKRKEAEEVALRNEALKRVEANLEQWKIGKAAAAASEKAVDMIKTETKEQRKLRLRITKNVAKAVIKYQPSDKELDKILTTAMSGVDGDIDMLDAIQERIRKDVMAEVKRIKAKAAEAKAEAA